MAQNPPAQGPTPEELEQLLAEEAAAKAKAEAEASGNDPDEEEVDEGDGADAGDPGSEEAAEGDENAPPDEDPNEVENEGVDDEARADEAESEVDPDEEEEPVPPQARKALGQENDMEGAAEGLTILDETVLLDELKKACGSAVTEALKAVIQPIVDQNKALTTEVAELRKSVDTDLKTLRARTQKLVKALESGEQIQATTEDEAAKTTPEPKTGTTQSLEKGLTPDPRASEEPGQHISTEDRKRGIELIEKDDARLSKGLNPVLSAKDAQEISRGVMTKARFAEVVKAVEAAEAAAA